MSLVRAGGQAPAFALSNQHAEIVRRDDLFGSPALLVFFPLVLTPVCEGELEALVRRQETWDDLGARVVGLSVDHRYSLRDAADRLGVGFDLLSDFWPHGDVARAFGCFDHERGHATRHSFVLDAAGRVTRVISSGRERPRAAEDYEAALRAVSA